MKRTINFEKIGNGFVHDATGSLLHTSNQNEVIDPNVELVSRELENAKPGDKFVLEISLSKVSEKKK